MKGSYVEVSHTLLSRVKGLTDNLASAGVNLTGQLEDEEKTSSLGKQLLMVFSLSLSSSSSCGKSNGPYSRTSSPAAQPGAVATDISSRLAPQKLIVRDAMRVSLGSTNFGSRILNEHDRL